MSTTKNNRVRCDWCGKLSSHPLGEYTRPDGTTAGYINSPEWERNEDGSYKDGCGTSDICEECEAGHCPACGADEVVSTTPTVAGPVGFGERCKACGHKWPVTNAET